MPRAGSDPVPAGRRSQSVPIGSIKRRGRWRIDRDMDLETVIGSIKLDLRQAEVHGADVTLHLKAVLGSVKVWIPYGIAVEVDGESVLGSRTVDEDSPGPGAPILRLRIDTVIGSVKVFRV